MTADSVDDLPFTWEEVLGHVKAQVSSLYSAQLPVDKIGLFGAQSGFFMLPMRLAAAGNAPPPLVFDLAVCSAYGHAYHRLIDWQVDELALSPCDALLLAPLSELYETSLRDLAGAEFAELNVRRRGYYARFLASHELDGTHIGRIKSFSSSDLLALGDKSAPVMVLFDLANSVCCGRIAVDPDLLDSCLRFLTIGLQVEDDLQDYASDFEAKNFTYPITTALVLSDTHKIVDSLAAADVGGLIRELEIDYHCHRVAAAAFTHAEKLATAAGSPLLADAANRCATVSTDATKASS